MIESKLLELAKQIKASLCTKWNRAKGTNKSSKVPFFMAGTSGFVGGIAKLFPPLANPTAGKAAKLLLLRIMN